jgi:hypothetical protein
MEFCPDSTYKQDIAETYAGYRLVTGLHLAIIRDTKDMSLLQNSQVN